MSDLFRLKAHVFLSILLFYALVVPISWSIPVSAFPRLAGKVSGSASIILLEGSPQCRFLLTLCSMVRLPLLLLSSYLKYKFLKAESVTESSLNR